MINVSGHEPELLVLRLQSQRERDGVRFSAATWRKRKRERGGGGLGEGEKINTSQWTELNAN